MFWKHVERRLTDGRVVYAVSMNDILLFEKLFRLNIGVSVEAMNFYNWMKSKNRKGEYRVLSMIESEWDEVEHGKTMEPDYRSLFTIKSIRAKVNANQRAFDKKRIGEYVDQLLDVGLLVVKAHDEKSPTNDRILGLDPFNEIKQGNITFDSSDVWDYVERYAGTHVWLDDEGREWLDSFVQLDMNQSSDVLVRRGVPWEGVV